METAAEASLAASLSKLADRNKMWGQNELDVRKCENRNKKHTSEMCDKLVESVFSQLFAFIYMNISLHHEKQQYS